MKKFEARIKEVGNDHVQTTIYIGADTTTISFLEDFWGVHEPGVESYEIREVPFK